MDEQLLRQLISDCFEYKAIKFGDFVLKTGVHSPIYLDIRVVANTAKPLVIILYFDSIILNSFVKIAENFKRFDVRQNRVNWPPIRPDLRRSLHCSVDRIGNDQCLQASAEGW